MIFCLLVDSGCSYRDDGLYPDPKDCSKFIQCSNGQAYSKNCAVGLYFNEKLKVCDWPSNVNCHGGKYRYGKKIPYVLWLRFFKFQPKSVMYASLLWSFASMFAIFCSMFLQYMDLNGRTLQKTKKLM